MKKFLSTLLMILILMQTLCIVSFAEDASSFPPQRPAVGNMKVVTNFSSPCVVVGLRTNGTINIREELYAGVSMLGEDNKNLLLSQTDVVDIACTIFNVALLKSNGTVFVPEREAWVTENFNAANGWTDIVAIDCGAKHLVGLKADGTVVAVGVNDKGQCDVMGWNNVSKIYAYKEATIAIKKDGTLLATGNIKNFSELRKLTGVIDVLADQDNEFGALLSDGTITKKEFVRIKRGESGFSEDTELNLNVILEKCGFTNKIVSIEKGTSHYFFVDEFGDMYQARINRYNESTVEKVEERIISFDVYDKYYFALDENGQIWSNNMAFTSDDWILTTNITYNGAKIHSDVAPYIKDGRTLAPIRAILEALGMTVTWDGATQTATAVKDGVTINVTINSNIAIVNGIQTTLDVPAEITNGRTFVPVRFFGEALGMHVDWDGYTKTVIIESK